MDPDLRREPAKKLQGQGDRCGVGSRAGAIGDSRVPVAARRVRWFTCARSSASSVLVFLLLVSMDFA